MKRITIGLGLLAAVAAAPAMAEDGGTHGMGQMMSPGLMLPSMDSARGRWER